MTENEHVSTKLDEKNQILWKFSQIVKNNHILTTLNFLIFLGTFRYLSVELAEFSFQTRFRIVNRHSSYDKEQPTYVS